MRVNFHHLPNKIENRVSLFRYSKMLPSSSRVMDVAYPYASPPLQQTLRFQSGLARIAPAGGEEERQDHGDDQKSRVRKMGVFLAVVKITGQRNVN